MVELIKFPIIARGELLYLKRYALTSALPGSGQAGCWFKKGREKGQEQQHHGR